MGAAAADDGRTADAVEIDLPLRAELLERLGLQRRNHPCVERRDSRVGAEGRTDARDRIRDRGGVAIAERLAKADPGNARWQRDLMVLCIKIAEVDSSQARAMLSRAAEIANSMQSRGILAPRDTWMIEELVRRIASLPD
jgi:hypothetical protein